MKCAFSLVLALVVFLAAPAWPQSSNGSVRGTVQDTTQAVIPNVNVQLTNTATGVELKTTSNHAGIYVFPAVLPGPYKLAADTAGMRKFEASVTVQVLQSATVDITLQLASTQTVVKLQAVTSMLITYT